MSKLPKKPPSKAIKSVQYDLFSQFVTNDQDSVSNTVELWESIPKYFFTPAQVAKLLLPSGLARPFKQAYRFNGLDYTVAIHPALIEQKDGSYRAAFPGVTEELVEEALKKILTNRAYGMHDSANGQTWVKFSLSMIIAELKRRGKVRSVDQIKSAIQTMGRCTIVLSKGKKEVWEGSILQDLVTVDRSEYVENSSALHYARLPLFISNAINKLEYRQYNIDRHMGLKTQLSRWLYKRFVHRYKQASMLETYHFKYSMVKEESRYLACANERDNRIKLISALNELKSEGVLMSYALKEYKEGRRITDVKYTVTASSTFCSEQKASNSAAKTRKEALVDNSVVGGSYGSH